MPPTYYQVDFLGGEEALHGGLDQFEQQGRHVSDKVQVQGLRALEGWAARLQAKCWWTPSRQQRRDRGHAHGCRVGG
jgi:hypothetical protein